MASRVKEAPEAIDELEALKAELDRQDRKRGELEAKAPKGFDPAALFLLKQGHENLFEPHGGSDWTFRCKGCGQVVTRTGRSRHFQGHKRSASSVKPTSPSTPKEEVPMAPAATGSKATGSKAAQNRQQREDKAKRGGSALAETVNDATDAAIAADDAASDVPEVEDVTGKEPEAKVSKTAVAIDNAVAVLKKFGKDMTTKEIMADPSMATVNSGTLVVMLSKELRAKKPRVKRVGKGTYKAT